jgi:hypothetical protein
VIHDKGFGVKRNTVERQKVRDGGTVRGRAEIAMVPEARDR